MMLSTGLRVCYQTAFTVLEFLIQNDITPANIDDLWQDTASFKRLLVAARLHAAYTAETARHGARSVFGRAVVELIIGRLRWATRQRGTQGSKLLWKGQSGWKWDPTARTDYATLLDWFTRGDD